MTTAAQRLQRLLLLLPEAAREGGVPTEDLARSWGVDHAFILSDIQSLESRDYYLPAGMGDQIQLGLAQGRLHARTTGEFRRPVKLTPREALALELGLRVLLRCRPAGDEEETAAEERLQAFETLHERLVEPLSAEVREADPAVALGELEVERDSILKVVDAAVRGCREIRILYRSPGDEPGARVLAPLHLAHAEGRWYLLGRDRADGGVRAFRLDRVLEAAETGEEFSPRPDDSNAVERFFNGGRVHDHGAAGEAEPVEVVVEYSADIARWIRERGWDGAEDMDDGALRVRHQVFDPEWIVRHVLGYGPDARVVEPKAVRERVVEAVRKLTG